MVRVELSVCMAGEKVSGAIEQCFLTYSDAACVLNAAAAPLRYSRHLFNLLWELLQGPN